MSASDAELIARSLNRDDRDAFGELVLRHQSAVRRFLRHLCNGNAAGADDLAQETFIRAYESLARFRGQSSFPCWLLGIAHNQHRNAWRRQRTADRAAGDICVPGTEESPARTSDLRNDLSEALRRLSAEENTALHLCYQQGLSHSEIAAVLDWPVGTVKTHLARSKQKLRELLSAWNPQT